MSWLTITLLALLALGVTGLVILARAAHKAPLMAPTDSRLDRLDKNGRHRR